MPNENELVDVLIIVSSSDGSSIAAEGTITQDDLEQLKELVKEVGF